MQKLKNGDKRIFDLIKDAVKIAGREEGWVTQEDIKHLPTKEEYYAREDETMSELRAIRENTTVQQNQVSQNSDRIEKLEKIHPKGRHPFTS